MQRNTWHKLFVCLAKCADAKCINATIFAFGFFFISFYMPTEHCVYFCSNQLVQNISLSLQIVNALQFACRLVFFCEFLLNFVPMVATHKKISALMRISFDRDNENERKKLLHGCFSVHLVYFSNVNIQSIWVSYLQKSNEIAFELKSLTFVTKIMQIIYTRWNSLISNSMLASRNRLTWMRSSFEQ